MFEIAIAMRTAELSRSSPFPKSLSACLVLVGGITSLIVLTSWVLLLNPLSPKIQGNFFNIDQVSKSKLFALGVDKTIKFLPRHNSSENGGLKEVLDRNGKIISSDTLDVDCANQSISLDSGKSVEKLNHYVPSFSNYSMNVINSRANDNDGTTPSNSNNSMEKFNEPFLGLSNNSRNVHSGAYDIMAPQNSSKPIKKIKQSFLGSSNVSMSVPTEVHDDNMMPSTSSEPMKKVIQLFPGFSNDSNSVQSGAHEDNMALSNSSKPMERLKESFSGFSNDSRNLNSGAHDDNIATLNSTMTAKVLSSSNSFRKVDPSSCDLYQGKWFYDPSGPLYTNNTCPVLAQSQNCQGNGRPDKDYENWRWKPDQCELPRFNSTEFLKLMEGKTLAFIGDSVARNHMESLLCALWQVEIPKNRGGGGIHRWHFKSTSTKIVRIWSSWLVHKTTEAFQFAPKGIAKLHLDIPDENFMKFLPSFDVVVLSGGHWFTKRSVYILNNEIVGGQLWRPPKNLKMKVDNILAFAASFETALSAIALHPNFTGLAILRSFSPNHYKGGAWNTGGSCTGKFKPALENELVTNGHTNKMHQKQVTAFNKAIKKATNKSKMRLLDVTKVFGYRHDGHPGPFRNLDPNKVTSRGPHGEPPPQDCLHWCMPGAIDTWNELLVEILRREFKGAS